MHNIVIVKTLSHKCTVTLNSQTWLEISGGIIRKCYFATGFGE